MNLFRLAGDLLHLWSVVLMLLTIFTTKSCSGVSRKTQELYLAVFLTRYVDVFYLFVSFYNTAMKIVFVATAGLIVYFMRTMPYSATYDKEQDTFKVIYLIVPAFILGLVWNYAFTLPEILWSFSIFLEAVAIMPQLFLLQRTRDIASITSHYIAALGSYRVLYMLNWVWRLATERGYRNPISWVAGIVQSALYGDFFYYYLQSRWKGTKLQLPS